MGRSSTGLQSQQILMVQQYDATHGLPSVKDSKRRRRQFQLSSASTFHSSLASKLHSSAFVLMLRKNFSRREDFRDSNERKSREEYDEIFLLRSIEDFSIAPNWAFTRYDRRTDRSVRLVCPTSRMKRLHVPMVGPTGRSDPGYVRLSVRPVGQTVGQTVAEPPTSVNQINVAC